jgi:hypothetical protein
MGLCGFTAGGFERPSPLLVHDHERKSDPESDCALMRTGLHTRIAMPTFISIGDDGELTFVRTVEDIARAGISAEAATLAHFLVNYRGHLLPQLVYLVYLVSLVN